MLKRDTSGKLAAGGKEEPVFLHLCKVRGGEGANSPNTGVPFPIDLGLTIKRSLFMLFVVNVT